MAQYIQLIDQHPAGEELQATYSNIVDHQGNQYIIQTCDSNQALLIDNVIEQPVIQQYPQQQQLYFVSSPQKQQTMQPIVLNHTLQQPVVLNNASPLRAMTRASVGPRPRSSVGVVTGSSVVTGAPRMLRGVVQQNLRPRSAIRVGAQAIRAARPSMVVQQQEPVALNGSEMIKLEDGRIVSVEEYQKMLEIKKAAQLQQAPVTLNASPRPGAIRGGRPGPSRPAARQPIKTRPELQMTAKQSISRIIQPNACSRLPKILREFVASPEIKDIINQNGYDDEFENSIRMYVLLSGGEQRLITFTTPKEDCTIQEILEQVGVTVHPDTKIAMNEINKDGINIVVSVGYDFDDDDDEPMPTPSPKKARSVPNKKMNAAAPFKVSSPLPEDPPKLVPGQMAVCSHCGYVSEDFNRCQRCKSKLPQDIKTVPAKAESGQRKKNSIEINLKPRSSLAPPGSGINTVSTKIAPARKRLTRTKLQEAENMIVTLSSDEEEDDSSNEKPSSYGSTDKEPTIDALLSAVPIVRNNVSVACCTIACRTIRIGSYRFSPEFDISVNGNEMVMKVPHKVNEVLVDVRIPRQNVHKVLVNFQKTLPVIFIYLLPEVSKNISTQLGLTPDGDYYYSASENQLHRRIVLLPPALGVEDKLVLTTLYDNGVLEEISAQDANSILLMTCSTEVAHAIMAPNNSPAEIRQLLIYPPGKGGISINTEDYMCLERDQFLNDVIIDFYLKYMMNELAKELRDKVQVFSTFFYTRLTTKPAKNLRKSHPTEVDPYLTPAQKRHARVKNWTKNIDLFSKDFIIVPINENAHWFLAIICFPGMRGAETFNGVKVSNEVVRHVSQKTAMQQKQIALSQIKAIKTHIAEIDENSDKDEAEGDESEFDTEESENTAIKPQKIVDVPIKQPCILIFDSLAGAGRSRVVATLRDYLTCEYAAKNKGNLVYTKHIIPGVCPKIPQQNNYTDCGLYLLQYVEHFINQPINDYRLPINGLKDWFEEIVVTRKREDISNLIKELMSKYNKNMNMLPHIILPTKNGELVPENSSDKEDDDSELGKDLEKPGVESSLGNPTDSFIQTDTDTQLSTCGSNSPGSESNSRQSTMSYLKSKRIIKPKPDTSGDSGEDSKKRKLQE